jgi:CheY-like chemotaxis protein
MSQVEKNFMEVIMGASALISGSAIGESSYIFLDLRFNFSSSSDNYINPINETPHELIARIRAQSLRILVVDDEDMFREAMTYNLSEKFGAKVTEVRSGSEALNKLKEGNNYELIFLDLMMQHRNGIDTYHSLRLLDRECRVIIMSAYSESTEWNRAKELNLEMVTKPIPEKILTYILGGHCRRGE